MTVERIMLTGALIVASVVGYAAWKAYMLVQYHISQVETML